MTDRELMQEVLDALCDIIPANANRKEIDWIQHAAITALRSRLAQPEQEPVAWIDEFGNVFPLGAQRGPKHLNEPMKPLYTAPPQRKPLTDEEIEREWQFLYDEEGNPPDHHDFARAIEAAHGIKENT